MGYVQERGCIPIYIDLGPINFTIQTEFLRFLKHIFPHNFLAVKIVHILYPIISVSFFWS